MLCTYLVNDHDTVGHKVWLREELSQQHPVSHILDDCPLARAVLKSDAVAHLVT